MSIFVLKRVKKNHNRKLLNLSFKLCSRPRLMKILIHQQRKKRNLQKVLKEQKQ